MFKKRLKGLLAMVLAGSIAATALPLTASATISDNYVDVCEVNRYNSTPVRYYELQKDESVSPYLNENNLWGVYYSYSYYDSGYTPAKELSATGTEAFSGDMLEGKFDGFADTNINDYSDIRITAQHKYIVTTDDPSAAELSGKSALTTSTFPVEIPLTNYNFSANPLMDYSCTPWYSTTDVYGNIYSQYAVQSTDEPVRFSAGDESISIGMDTFKGLYSADIHTGNQNDAIEIFLNGITILQLKSEYKTLDIPVLNGLGTQQIKGGNPYTISVTGGLTQNDWLESISNYFYVGYTNKNGEVVLSNSYMNNKQAAWEEIEAFANDPNFDANKLFFLRPLNVSVYKDSTDIGSFNSRELLLAKNDPENLPEAYKYIEAADDNSIWKLPLKFVPGKDLLTEIETYLNKVPDIGYFSLTETTEIMVTGTEPVSCEINEYYEISPESYEISPLYVETVPATISDHAAVLEKAGALKAGNIFDTSGWQLWGCEFESGAVNGKHTIWKFKESDLESTDGVNSIGIDQLNTVPVRSYPLIYIPQVQIAPSLEVTAPVAGETPSFEYTIKDTVGGYEVLNVEWSCGNTLLLENDKFEAGKEYTVKIELCGSFVDSTPVTINGKEAFETILDDACFSVYQVFTTAPEKPVNVKADAGDGKVDLSWEASEGAFYYSVYLYNEDGTLRQIATIEDLSNDLSYTVENLANGTEYGFLITAVSEACVESSYTAEDVVYATPTAAAVKIAKPVVTATPGNGQVTLTWGAVPTATVYYIYSYLGNDQYAYLGETTTCSFTAAGLTNGQEYKFLVRAFNSTEGSDYDINDLVSATPAGKIAKPVVTATPGNGQVTLTWNAVPTAVIYYVYSYLGNDQYAYLGEAATCSFTAAGLTNGQEYKFLVRAFSTTEGSDYDLNDLVSATPAGKIAKPVVTATPGNGQVTLTWNAVPTAVIYYVYSYLGNDQYAYLGEATTCSFTATGLTNGQEYKFLVRAFSSTEGSDFDLNDLVSATPAGKIAKPVVTATPGNGQVTLTWREVPTAVIYYVYSYLGNDQYAYLGEATTCSFTAMGLTNGQEYKFLVRAFSNTEGSDYDLNDLVSATPAGKIAKPVVTATPGNGQVTLTWREVPTAVIYYVYSYLGNDQYAYLGEATTCSFTAAGLTNGQEYKFLVRAFNSTEGSDYDLNDLVSATPAGKIAKPVVTATPGNGQVTLTWREVPTAVIYYVYSYLGNDQYAYLGEATTCSFTAMGLTNGQEYKFLVRAFSNTEGSDYDLNDLVSATPAGKIAKPVVTATPGDGQVTLTWNAVPTAVVYYVYLYIGNDQYAYLGEATTCSFTAMGLTNGQEYKFLVRAFSNTEGSDFDLNDLVSATPA